MGSTNWDSGFVVESGQLDPFSSGGGSSSSVTATTIAVSGGLFENGAARAAFARAALTRGLGLVVQFVSGTALTAVYAITSAQKNSGR